MIGDLAGISFTGVQRTPATAGWRASGYHHAGAADNHNCHGQANWVLTSPDLLSPVTAMEVLSMGPAATWF